MSSQEILFNKTTKSILHILSDGKIHSGEELGTLLGISRAAVWKAVQQLQTFGLPIQASTKTGYSLESKLDLLDLGIIKSQLNPIYSSLTSNIYLFDVIDSTNVWLNRYHTDYPEDFPVWCLAEMQTTGRGRFQRPWYSPFGCNIYLSLLWHFDLDPQELSGLTLAAGVAVIEALDSFVAPGALQLKWPNDIYNKHAKLGGILSELKAVNYDSSTVILGIGINVDMKNNSKQLIDQPWVSLRNLLNEPEKVSRNHLISTLMNHLINTMILFEKHGLQPFIERYKHLDISFNKEVCMILPKTEEKIKGISQSINDQGLFCIKQFSGEIKQFACGEVSLKLSGA